MSKSEKRESDHAKSDESKMTRNRYITAGAGALGVAGSIWALRYGYDPNWVFYTGTGVASGATVKAATNVQSGLGNVGADKVRGTKRGTAGLMIFGTLMAVTGLANAATDHAEFKFPVTAPPVTADVAPTNTELTQPTVVHGVLDPTTIATMNLGEGSGCDIAPYILDKGDVHTPEDRFRKDTSVILLKEYLAQELDPATGQPLFQGTIDKTAGKDLSRAVNGLQIMLGIDPTLPWNGDTCARSKIGDADKSFPALQIPVL